MDKLITNIYNIDLDGLDIERLTRGKAVVRLYKDLLDYTNIVDALGKHHQMILLFPTTSDTMGHWIAVLCNNKTITHFDSYGLSWKQELGYSHNAYTKQNLLGVLYNKAMQDGYRVDYNHQRLQEMRSGINTCGRWCAMRCRFSYLDSEEFAKLFIKQKESPDYLITILTFIALREEEKDEEQIIKQLQGKSITRP